MPHTSKESQASSSVSSRGVESSTDSQEQKKPAYADELFRENNQAPEVGSSPIATRKQVSKE
jgi:hypothetical protein